MEHEKKASMVRKLEMKRGQYVKTEKTKKEVEKLESLMMVASQAIESTSAEINKLRETELYPQLLELVKRFVSSIIFETLQFFILLIKSIQSLRVCYKITKFTVVKYQDFRC